MRSFESQLLETRLYPEGIAGRFRCPAHALPAPGQYLQAWGLDDYQAELPHSLFPAALEAEAFLAAPPLPSHWQAGARIGLRGPLGQGFQPPQSSRRIALAAVGDSALRLFPLMFQALTQGCSVTLFANCRLPAVPAAVEIHPLDALVENLTWPDYLACDGLDLEGLRHLGGLFPPGAIPFPVQALLSMPMPCGGLAECGVCAVPDRRGDWKLVCSAGPVFDLRDLIP